MSIIKNSIMKSSTEKGLVPTDDLLFFHESDSLGAPYHKETTNLYYVMGSNEVYTSGTNYFNIYTDSVTLTVTHSHTSNTSTNLIIVDDNGYYNYPSIHATKTVTAKFIHYHRYHINFNSSPFIKKAIKLYLYRANIGDELPAGAVVLSDREDIPGCTKMGDNTDQFLFVINNSTTPSGTDGIGLSTVPLTLKDILINYYLYYHGHGVNAKLSVDSANETTYYEEQSGIDPGYLLSDHRHGDINGEFKINPSTVILRLFKYNNSGTIKEGMIVGSRSEDGFDGFDGWNRCDGANNTPNIHGKCPVINNSKPINETYTGQSNGSVNISTLRTDTVSPSVLDHSSKHFDYLNNMARSRNYSSGSDSFLLYESQSTIVVDSSSTSHDHEIHIETKSTNYFGRIIFFKFSG